MTVRGNSFNDPVRQGNVWVIPSTGRTFPVISGGDETAGEGGSVVVDVPTEPAPTTQPDGEHVFTAEQVEAIRKQEKDKLYGDLESSKKAAEEATRRAAELETQMAAFNEDRDQRLAAEKEKADAEAAERKAREESEMESRELIARREAEFEQKLAETENKWSQQFEELNERAKAQEATLEMERAFQALEAHKAQRIAEAGDSLMPHLIDLVGGNTVEEIDASISAVAAKTSAIMEDMQQGLAAQRGPKAVPTTGASPTGPLENQTAQQTLTRDDIRNMSMEQYAAHRPQLLEQARPRG